MLSIIITLLVNLLIKASESFIVMVPADPVVAHVGSSVILSCWISPPENAEALEIRWYRHDFNNPVLLYNHGKIQDTQEESYRNRSALKPWSDQSGGLKDGDVSLRLEKLRVQDEGPFHCYVSGDTVYDSREIALKITDSSDSSDPSGPWKALFFSVLICALLGLVGLILYKYRHKLTGQKPAKESCEEETMEKLAKEELERSGSPVEEHLQSAMNHLTNCEKTMKKLTKEVVGEDADIEELRKYADQKFGIDRQHAYPNLTISQDSKSMRDHPGYNHTGEAFPYKLCAFGAQKYSSGRHYWEVLLVQKNAPPKNYWLIGVMKDENVAVKKKLALTPSNGYWFLCLEGQNGIYSNTDPQVKLSLTPRPEQLGVLLDYDDGQLSFYNVTERKHLLTISSRFSGSVVPLFNPGVGDPSSLKILDCPKAVKSAAKSSQPFLSPDSTPAKSSTSNTSKANRNSNTVSSTV